MSQYLTDDVVTVIGQCVRCKEEVRFNVARNAWNRYVAGELVQKAFPSLSASYREFLISRYCGECFDELQACFRP